MYSTANLHEQSIASMGDGSGSNRSHHLHRQADTYPTTSRPPHGSPNHQQIEMRQGQRTMGVTPAGSAANISTQDRDHRSRNKLYQDVWRNVWLRPNIRNLTSDILNGSEKTFHHGSAALLLSVVETQIIYQQYRNAVSSTIAEKEIPPDILLSCDDVIGIIATFSKDLVPYHGTVHTSSVNRALQFRVLASSLSLLQLLGTTNLSKSFHDDLRNEITERLKDIKNARARAKDGGREIYSFGDAELFAQFSLDILSQMPSDVGQAVAIIRGIANVFFAVGLIYTYNIPQAIDCLAVWNELPSNPGAWYKPFHELYSIALGAVCLSHHGQANSNPEFSSLAVDTALSTVKQLDQDFRGELSRLTAPPRKTGVVNRMRNSHVATNLVGPGSERWAAAFGMLFIVNMLAEAPCGKNSQFSKLAKDLAITTIKCCQSRDELAMLRFKAFEILISLQETRGHPELEINFAEVLAQPRSALGRVIRNMPRSVPQPTPTMQAEGKASTERFRFKRACDIESMGFCLDKVSSLREKEAKEHELSRTASVVQQRQQQLQHSMQEQMPHTPSPSATAQSHQHSEPRQRLRIEQAASDTLPERPSAHTTAPEGWAEKVRKGKGWMIDSFKPMSWGSTTPSPEPPAEKTSGVRAELQGDDLHPLGIYGIEPAQPQPTLSIPTPSATPAPPQGSVLLSPTTSSRSHPRRDSRSTNASGTSWKLRQWQEPAPRIRIVQANPDKKPRKFDFGSKARSVVLSPDKQFAVFAFEKKIRVGSLVSFPAGSTKVDAPIVKIWPTDQLIKAVAVSSEILVVASEGEVKVCPIDRGQSSPGSYGLAVNTESAMSLPDVYHSARITSIAISRDSSLIAVGQRIDVHKKNRTIREGVVQLYSREPFSDPPYYTAMSSGRLSLGEGAEPAHVTISPDTTTILCAYAASLYTWRRDPTWRRTRIKNLELTLQNRHNPGSRGITSITVFPAPGDPDRAYCIITAILSAIPGENTTATVLAPLDDAVPRSLRCPYPVSDPLARAAVSDAGDIAVFLSDTAQLRVCRLTPPDGGSGLLISHPEGEPGRMGPGHRLEPRLCARLGVRTDGQDCVVVGVEPDGKVWETRIKVSRFERESEPAELMAASPVLLGN